MNFEYEGYSPLATDDAPEVFYPLPPEDDEHPYGYDGVDNPGGDA